MATKRQSSGKRVSVYSTDHKHIPITRTEFVKRGSKWVKTDATTYMGSINNAQLTLSKTGIPFEKSHRLTKRNRFGHSHPYDTFSSISPDGKQKTEWYVDYEQGDKNYYKLTKKAHQDRIRRKKKKAAK